MSGSTLLDHVVTAGEALWRASWQASVLAVLIGVIHWLAGRRISPRWRHAMWMLVLVRLALPVVPSSPVSFFNLAPANATPIPQIDSPRPAVEFHRKTLDLPSRPRTTGELIVVDNVESATPGEVEQAAVQAPVASVVEVAPPKINWLQVAGTVWLCVAALLAIRIAWASWRVSRMIRRLNCVDNSAASEILATAAAEIGVRRLPTLLAGDELFSPALVGCIQPKLLVPSELLVRFDLAELRLIFLHELAHLKRRDVAINWIATLLNIIHWPNPIVWLAVRRLRLERELACDELVVSRANDTERRAYGHTIVKLLETFSRGVSPMPGSVGILEGKEQMKRRITMIARFAERNRVWSAVAAVLVLGLGACALTDGTKAEAVAPQTQPKEKASDATPTTGRAPALADAVAQAILRSPATRELRNDDVLDVFWMSEPGRGLYVIRIDEQGMVDVPKLNEQLKASGLTETQLAEAITKAYAKRTGDTDFATVGLAPKGRLRPMDDEADAKPPKAKPATIQAGELVAVSVMDLVGPGIETLKTSRVREDGKINFPYIGEVQAAGLTPAQLEKSVGKAFRDGQMLDKPTVVVSMPDRGESHVLAREKKQFEDPTAPGRSREEAAMAVALDRKLSDINFESSSFSDVIGKLRDLTNMNFSVDWRALETEGIDRNAPVTLRLRNVSLKDMLTIMLREMNPKLQFKAENQVIQIIIAEPPPKPVAVEVRAYDVADLLPDSLPEGESFQTRTTQLADVITQNIRPESWRKPNQPGENSATVFGVKIVVSASAEVHGEVEKLLKMLRDRPSRTPPASRQGARKRAEDMSAEDIAPADPQTYNHLRIRDQTLFELETAKTRYGEKSPQITQLIDALKVRDRLIQERVEWFHAKWQGYVYIPGDGMNAAPPPRPDEIRFEMPRVMVPAGREEFFRKLWDKEYVVRVYELGGKSNLEKISEEFRAAVEKMSSATTQPAATAPAVK